MGGGRNRSQQKKGGPEPRKVINIVHEVKLHTTQNAWKPGRKTTDKSAESEAIKNEVRNFLGTTRLYITVMFIVLYM